MSSDGAAALHRRERHDQALRAAVVYLIVGTAWVLGTDLLLYDVIDDRAQLLRLQNIKGWCFVVASAAGVYFLTRRAMDRVHHVEALMRAVVQSITDGILLVGRNQSIIDANPAAVAMLGVGDKKALVGMGPEAFCRRFHLTDASGHLVPPREYAAQRALRGEPAQPYKAILHPDPKRSIVITATAAPVRTTLQGDVELVVSVMHDQTELDRFERTRDEFFAAAAHTLKTPIAVIKGHAQMLSVRTGEEVDRAATRAIDRQCTRLDQLVQNLLVAGRLRSRSLQLFLRRQPLDPIVDDLVREIRRARAGRELVEEEGGVNLGVVFVDAERTAHALRNVVVEGFVRSALGTTVTLLRARGGGNARVGVRWFGAPTQDDGRPEVHGGLRLGEYVTNDLIRAQGGKVSRETSPRGVTTVWVEVPVVAEEQ